MALPGEMIGGYTVDRAIGRGGTAQVFLAHRLSGDDTEQVALKVLDGRHHNPENIDRIHREYELAQRFSHPRIVRVYDHGEGWLAMEILDGGSAQDLVGTTQTWIVEIKLMLLQQIAGALDYIHSHDVIHCDVKPSNIMRRANGGAVLTDFGLAQSLSEAMGPRRPVVQTSLPYAAPEVLLGRPMTAATDQYALACTAVDLFHGKPPFTARTTHRLIDMQINSVPAPISYWHDNIPHAFDSVVLKALNKDPLKRYATCVEFVTLLTHTFA